MSESVGSTGLLVYLFYKGNISTVFTTLKRHKDTKLDKSTVLLIKLIYLTVYLKDFSVMFLFVFNLNLYIIASV